MKTTARFGPLRPRSLRLAVACLSLFAGCKADPEPAPAVPVVADPRPDILAPGTSCAEDGRWKPCTLLDRVERAGLGIKEVASDTTRVGFLEPIGLHYQVGKNGVLIAFYYQDSLQAKQAWEKLDTLRLVPPGDTVTPWPSRPSSIRAANLIGAFFGSSAPQIERIHLLFEAGLPAPKP